VANNSNEHGAQGRNKLISPAAGQCFVRFSQRRSSVLNVYMENLSALLGVGLGFTIKSQ
jgi:hypothetical protein